MAKKLKLPISFEVIESKPGNDAVPMTKFWCLVETLESGLLLVNNVMTLEGYRTKSYYDIKESRTSTTYIWEVTNIVDQTQTVIKLGYTKVFSIEEIREMTKSAK